MLYMDMMQSGVVSPPGQVCDAKRDGQLGLPDLLGEGSAAVTYMNPVSSRSVILKMAVLSWKACG